jgi:hypothetical protein
MPDLHGRRAIITGGTTRIGRAIAVLLASYGVKVYICGRPPAPLDDALERVAEVREGAGGNIDLAIADDVDRFSRAPTIIRPGSISRSFPPPFPPIACPTLAKARHNISAIQISRTIGSARKKPGDGWTAAVTLFSSDRCQPCRAEPTVRSTPRRRQGFRISPNPFARKSPNGYRFWPDRGRLHRRRCSIS